MESLFINEETSSEKQGKTFASVALKHYRLPDDASQTYRIFYPDGTTQEVKAENASHAYQLSKGGRIDKIISLRELHKDVVHPEIVQSSGMDVQPDIMPHEKETLLVLADVMERETPVFEAMDYQSMALLSTKLYIENKSSAPIESLSHEDFKDQ